MALGVVTPTPHHNGRHSYTCPCLTCRTTVASRTPSVCRCDKPGPVDDGNCVRCGRQPRARPAWSGATHKAGCFYGGPEDEAYWFAVEGCPLNHDGDLDPLTGSPARVREALEHLRLAGLLCTGEST